MCYNVAVSLLFLTCILNYVLNSDRFYSCDKVLSFLGWLQSVFVSFGLFCPCRNSSSSAALCITWGCPCFSSQRSCRCAASPPLQTTGGSEQGVSPVLNVHVLYWMFLNFKVSKHLDEWALCLFYFGCCLVKCGAKPLK